RFIDVKSKTISTAAGNGERGFSGDGGPSQKAQLAQPHSIQLDRADNVYICDIMNNRVRKIDAKTRTITTFAGTGERANTPTEASLEGTPLARSEEHTSELQSRGHLVCRLLLEKKKQI